MRLGDLVIGRSEFLRNELDEYYAKWVLKLELIGLSRTEPLKASTTLSGLIGRSIRKWYHFRYSKQHDLGNTENRGTTAFGRGSNRIDARHV